jgi:hypothetical protein
MNEAYAQAIEYAGRSAEGTSAGRREVADVAQEAASTTIDSLPRLAPGSTGLPILSENRINGLVHEAVVHWRLADAGYHVTNLNVDVMDNFPIADLVAHNQNHRLIVQVRGATGESGSFRTKKTEIERLDRLARTLNHHGVYAFVFGQVGVEFRTTTMMLKQSGSKDELGSDSFLLGAELAISLDQMICEQDQDAVVGDDEVEFGTPGLIEMVVKLGDEQDVYAEITISEAGAFAQALIDLSDTAEWAGDRRFS